jgi:hypothetical protein
MSNRFPSTRIVHLPRSLSRRTIMHGLCAVHQLSSDQYITNSLLFVGMKTSPIAYSIPSSAHLWSVNIDLVGTVADGDNPEPKMGVSHLRVQSWYANLSMRGVQTTSTDPFCMPNRRIAMVRCKAIMVRLVINNLHTYKLNEGRLRLRVTPIAVKSQETRLCNRLQNTHSSLAVTAGQASTRGDVPVGRWKRVTLPGK